MLKPLLATSTLALVRPVAPIHFWVQTFLSYSFVAHGATWDWDPSCNDSGTPSSGRSHRETNNCHNETNSNENAVGVGKSGQWKNLDQDYSYDGIPS
jgi:hypothetical protein